MKTKILKFSLLTAALGIGLWSCKKGMEPIINSNEIQASKINTNQFSHNYRIKNIFNAFVNESIINKEKIISIINLEFEDELNYLKAGKSGKMKEGGVAVSAVSGGWWGIIVGAVSASFMSAN